MEGSSVCAGPVFDLTWSKWQKETLVNASYTLVEILYLGDMLLWNQMKLKITPMVLGIRSS